ncbi:ATP-binding protein [Autumnicola musiva]|uniref:histidine kinase n=1 Tax=Autumnicola musiva TaxID=3075589 RepID=A0ABU3DAA8_9FLAO|nr:ATP-binding protein [Zunongwangia sp. F117]MDT0678475.1 ATP-binding protein [Zunongwangia sp. F117]
MSNSKRTYSDKELQKLSQLYKSRKILRTVFDTTNQAIAVFETIYNADSTIKDFKFIEVNKILLDMYLDNNPLGKTFLETSTWGVKMGIFGAFKNTMEIGQVLNEEFQFDKDGNNRWFCITAKPQDNLLIATIEDISLRKIEAEKLKENIRFEQNLTEASPETIVIINLSSYCVRYINKHIFPEAGMTKERIQGTPLLEVLPFIHPQDRNKIVNMHKKLVKAADDEVIEIELRLKLRNASWEWFNIRGKIFERRSVNWVEEYILVVRNITEYKSTQEALLKAERLSIQGEVARVFAHELRNPLASIRMSTDILNKKLDVEQKKEIENYLEILSRSTKTIDNLIGNLLNASNYSPAVLVKENLVEILNDTLNKASDRIYLAGIKVVKEYKEPTYILADKEKLIIALLNIIVNATEATIPNEGILEIKVKKHLTESILSIQDNGYGLQPPEIDRLFDAFYTNKETGVGVGLTSVKNILEEHDAQIKVKSTPNEGTCFEIFFQNDLL